MPSNGELDAITRESIRYSEHARQELQRIQDQYTAEGGDGAVLEFRSDLVDHIRHVLNSLLLVAKPGVHVHEAAAGILCTAVRLSEHHFERSERSNWMKIAAESTGEFQDQLLAGRLLGNLGNSLAAQGQLDEASVYLERRLQHAEKGDDPATINMAREHMGKLKLRQGFIDEAESLLQKAYDMAIELGEEQSVIRLLKDVADAVIRRGETDRGLQMHRQRIERSRARGDLLIEFSSTQILADRLADADRLAEARETAFVALELCEKLRRPYLRANMLGTLGNIIYDEGDFAEAHRHYQKARRVYQRLGRVVEIGRTSTNLGLTSWKLGRLRQAENYFRAALKIDRETGRLRDAATDLGNLAGVLGVQRKLIESATLYEERIELLTELGDTTKVERTKEDLADVKALLQSNRQ